MHAVVKSGKTALLAALRLGFTPAEIVTTGFRHEAQASPPPSPMRSTERFSGEFRITRVTGLSRIGELRLMGVVMPSVHIERTENITGENARGSDPMNNQRRF